MKTVKYLNKRASTKEENRITKFNSKHKEQIHNIKYYYQIKI